MCYNSIVDAHESVSACSACFDRRCMEELPLALPYCCGYERRRVLNVVFHGTILSMCPC